MSDNKDENWQITLDELLTSPPEDVLAMFQNDLRRNLHPIQAGLDILIDEENTVEESKQLLIMIKKNATEMQNAFDYIMSYLKARQEMKIHDDNSFQIPKRLLDKVFSLDELFKHPTEIKQIFLHDLRMFYSPLETSVEILFEQISNLDEDHVIKMMKQYPQLIDKYVDHIQSYLKARQDMNNKTET